MNYLKREYYEHGNKNTKLLSHAVKKMAAKRTIVSLKTKVNSQQQILSTFMEYYKDLYKSEVTSDINTKTFIQTLPISQILEEH